MTNFEKVKQHLLNLGQDISEAVAEDGIFVINSPEKGIINMVLDCESDVLIIEQVICPLATTATPEQFKKLLQINRTLVHGAFVIDEESSYLIFKDTLELENLDITELEASINALALCLAENYNILLEVAGVDSGSISAEQN